MPRRGPSIKLKKSGDLSQNQSPKLEPEFLDELINTGITSKGALTNLISEKQRLEEQRRRQSKRFIKVDLGVQDEHRSDVVPSTKNEPVASQSSWTRTLGAALGATLVVTLLILFSLGII